MTKSTYAILTVLAALFTAMLFAACDEAPSARPTELPLVTKTGPECRFYVEKLATFDDPTAYHKTRGIYLIRDRETEQEFIGVSGIGISELGSHKTGTTKNRHTVEDER